MADTGDLTSAQYYDRLRSQIEHEDELINLRVVWQLLAQSFFFSTYAALLNAKEPAKNSLFDEQQHLLLWVIPIAALVAGLLTYIGILTALKSIAHLRRRYEHYAGSKADTDQTTKLFPDIQGPAMLRKLSAVPPIGLPLLFIVTWLIILVRLVMAAMK